MNSLPEKWLACQQNANDRIRFIEYSNPEETSSLPYHKFFDYIKQVVAIDGFDNFRTMIDRFKKVLLDLETGKWFEFKQEEDISGLTFEQLLEMNREEEQKEKHSGSKLVDYLWEKRRPTKGAFNV